jgi:hypothetical protein
MNKKGNLYRQAVVEMLKQGEIPPMHGVLVDAYNHSVNGKVAVTIVSLAC